jgi:uncharacterized lipoprotein YddW (UPF0748 family)
MPAVGRPLAQRALAVLAVCFCLGQPAAEAQDEVRALWVVRTTLTSASAIDAMVTSARSGGFNTLLVQVRGRGDAFYAGGAEPRAAQLSSQPPSFDPLAYTIARAHAAGLRVHAWMNTNLVAGVAELPADRRHIVYRHPEWLMVPRAIAEDLLRIDPSRPEYLQRLAEYVRTRPFDLEGLYLSPLTPEAAEYTAGVVREVVRRYAVDGIHLDYVRYPSDDFDYARSGLSAFRRSVVEDLPVDERRAHDSRLDREPLAYADAFPERWRTFRQSQLTRLVMRIRQTIKAVRPSTVLSAAVVPDPHDASTRRLQDWPAWIAFGLLDIVCPMAYTTDAGRFAAQVSTVRTLAPRRAVWVGIGAYQLSEEAIIANVRTAQRLEVGGIVLFSYDSLAGTARGPAHVSTIGRAAFAP